MPFDPNPYMMKLKNKDYLPVAPRLAWLRAEHPDAQIFTKLEAHELGKYALVFASVSLATGGSATGYGSETSTDFTDYLEKAETKAIGRALAALGYGTLHALELDEGGSVADSPVEPKARPATSAAAGAPIAPLPAANLATHGVMYEQAKGRENPPAQAPKAPEADPSLDAARAALKTAMIVHNWSGRMLIEAAGAVWPHVQTQQDFATLTTFQLTRLTDVVTGESIIDSGGRIVPAPEQPTIAAELSAAMR
jgi:hypothetical protein